MSDVPTANDIRITRAVIGALRTHDLSGFELWQWLGPVQGAESVLDEAALYPTLYRLEAKGLLRSAWHEDGDTRRVYRITAAGRAEAESHGWGVVAARRYRGDRRSTGSDTGEPEWSWREPAAPREPGAPPAPRPDEPQYEAVEAYVAELDAGLQLDGLHRHDVDAEIADHLCASIARREAEGEKPAEATEKAIAGLGPALDLARAINAAQLSRDRLQAGLSWGIAVGMWTSMLAFVVIFCLAFFLTPVFADALVGIAALFGIHLFAPGVPEWRTDQAAVAGWISAFLAARRSMPQFALRSRRSEAQAWPIWAAVGAVLFATVAVLFPFRLDAFGALTLLCVPVAWVLGTRRPTALYGETVTTRGVAIALLVAVPALLAPGARVWVYDPAGAPAHGSSYQAGAPVTARWEGQPGVLTGRIRFTSDAASGWSDPRLEVWPAVLSGPALVPDPDATAPAATFADAALVDFSMLSHSVSTWWLAITAVGPDGQRHTVDSRVHLGWRSHGRNDILAWLLGRR